MAERRSSWTFTISDNRWIWVAIHPDGTTQRSEVGFRSLQACAQDAIRNGYTAWGSIIERRHPYVPSNDAFADIAPRQAGGS
jgi:hypothetical protein